MNELTINTNNLTNRTPSVRITTADCQNMSDQELLQMLLKATGHTKDFKEYMGCDFPHSFLIETLKSRGFEQGWHKPDQRTATIILKKSTEKCVRQTFSIDKSVADEWKLFNANIPNKNVILQAALERFMADYRSGKIRFELQV